MRKGKFILKPNKALYYHYSIHKRKSQEGSVISAPPLEECSYNVNTKQVFLALLTVEC